MTRLQRLNKKGYKVTYHMSGRGCFASKNNGLNKVKGSSVTDLHRKIFGY